MRGIAQRLAQLLAVFVVVTFFTAGLISLVPGRHELIVIPFDQTGEQQQAFREANNLDEPLPVRWFEWVKDFVGGDMGNFYSATGGEPVSNRFGESWPVSLALILYTQVVALAIAVPLAIWAAYRSGGWVDKAINTTAFALISLPGFAVALLLTYFLGVKMRWLPTQGYERLSEDPVQHFKTVAIPVLSLAAGQIAVYMRLLRSDLVATLQEDFILMAKAKGISNGRVLWRHALRPSSLTLLTVTGLSMGNLIGGTIVVEYLLSIPGLGLMLGEAVGYRQYEALQSLVAVIAIAFVLINFAVDALYTVLDPRIRERSA